MRNATRLLFAILLGFLLNALPHAYADVEIDIPKAPITLENKRCLVEVRQDDGAVTRVLDKASGIKVAPPRELADNFRLLLLMPDNGTATILGKDQRLSSVRRLGDGLVLAWDGPMKDTAGRPQKLAARMGIRLVGNELRFTFHLDNNTADKVREVQYPILGGFGKFGQPGKPSDGVLWIPTSVPQTKLIRNPFGTIEWAYPGQANMAFCCIESSTARKSLYFASHDKIARYKHYRFEETTAGAVKDVSGAVIHYPFTPPGKTFDGSTVVLRVIDGDWRAAGRVYRSWFEKTFGICRPANCWIRRQSFFQFTMFKLPEGTINLTFKDIPRWAKDAKEHGINSVQISGWNVGGHDNGYPLYYTGPEPGNLARPGRRHQGVPQVGPEGLLLRQLPASDARHGVVQEGSLQVP